MDEFAAWAQAFGFELSPAQIEQFARYESLILEWNAKISLTAIREPRAIRLRHFLDSLTCATATGPLNHVSLIDIGSGAGFPGLPLKIMFPDLRLTLVDSVAKKARFLEHVAEALDLPDVIVLNERAETLGQSPSHRELYDWATGRAVADLRVLVELLLPFVRVGGSMLAQKGESALEELASAALAIGRLGGGEARISTVQLPEVEQTHYLVVIPKTVTTDPRYPRRAGMPAKRPL